LGSQIANREKREKVLKGRLERDGAVGAITPLATFSFHSYSTVSHNMS